MAVLSIDEFKRGFDFEGYIAGSLETRVSGGKTFAKCPFHNDSNPSMLIDGDRWYCFACGIGGDSIDFIMRSSGYSSINDVLKSTSFTVSPSSSPPKKKTEKKRTPPDDSIVMSHHKCLLNTKGKVDYFLERGITMESVEKYKLGYGKPYASDRMKPRYTIPVFDEHGMLVTIKYRIDPSVDDSNDKYLSHPGSSSYPFNTGILSSIDEVVYCGGQIDAILLTQEGIPTVSAPSEGVFYGDWVHLFDGKKTFVLMDNDWAGISGTKKVVGMMDSAIPVYWPPDKKKGYDINDAIFDKDMGIDGIKRQMEKMERIARSTHNW